MFCCYCFSFVASSRLLAVFLDCIDCLGCVKYLCWTCGSIHYHSVQESRMKCCVAGCGSAFRKVVGISFHSFPSDGALGSWNIFCGLDPGKPPHRSRKVCCLHFWAKDLLGSKPRQTPKNGAIPSVRIRGPPKPTQVAKINRLGRCISKKQSPGSAGIPDLIASTTNSSRNHQEHCYSVSPGSKKRKRDDDREERTICTDGAIPTRSLQFSN